MLLGCPQGLMNKPQYGLKADGARLRAANTGFKGTLQIVYNNNINININIQYVTCVCVCV